MSHPHPEVALADVTWLTALARSLVRDDHQADDLVQDTCMAAHRSPPERGGVTRAWLGAVLRNVHRRSLRSSTRRARREQTASRSEAVPSTADLVEQAELRRKLSECLLALQEPFRTTLMRVAFERRTPAEIAALEGITATAVRARLRKARALYKAKLERDYGEDWGKWQAALVPFANLPLSMVDGSPAPSPAGPEVVPDPGLTITPKTLTTAMSASGLLTTAALTIGAGALLLSTLSEGETPRPLGPTLALEPSAATPPGQPSPAPTAGRQRVRLPMPTATAPAVAVAPIPAGMIRLTGTLTGRQSWEREVVQSGHFAVRIGAEKRKIQIRNGTWSLDCEPANEIQFEPQAMAEGRPFVLSTDLLPTRSFYRDAEVDLQGLWLPATTLNVLDADTRAPITGLIVVKQDARVTLSEAAGKARPRSSPLLFEPRDFRAMRYAIRAEGYGWHTVELSPHGGGERELLLKRGVAELTVSFRGREGRAPLLSVTPTSALSAPSLAMGGSFQVGDRDSYVVRNLRPGEYEVTAAPGYGLPMLGVHTTLEPGANELVLDLAAPEMNQTWPVTVQATIPAAWNGLKRNVRLTENTPTGESLSFRPDQMQPIVGSENTWSLDAGSLNIGTWTAEIEGLGWGISFTVGQRSNLVRLVVPPPGIATLRVTDATTGEVLTRKTPGIQVWGTPRDVRTHDVGRSEYDVETGTWRIRAPQGRMTIGVIADNYQRQDLDVDINVSPTTVDVRMQQNCSLILQLFDGETRIPTDIVWATCTEIRPIEGSLGRRTSSHSEGEEWALGISASGTYELVFAPLDGYEPIPNARVTLSPGRPLRHRVDLVRKR